MNEKYIPIACSFHDLLLDRATRRSIVELEYTTAEGLQQKEAVFKDVYTQKGEEFLLIGDGEIIRLDHIVSVDGIHPPENNFC